MSKFNLKNVRSAFMKVWEKDTPKREKQKPAYRCSFILDKDDDADQIDALKEAFMEMASEKFGSAAIAEKWFKKNWLGDPKSCCVSDGDERDEVTEDFENKIVINTKTYRQPTIQTSKGENQTEKGITVDGDDIEGKEVYSGCMVNGSIDLWGWNSPDTGKGIGAGLLGIRFRDDGKAFGGGGETATDDDLSDEGGKSKSKGKDKAKVKAKAKAKPQDDEGDDEPKAKKKDKGEKLKAKAKKKNKE